MTKLNAIFERIKQNRLASHLLFWLVLMIFDACMHLVTSDDPFLGSMLFNLISYLPIIASAYLLTYIVFPIVFVRKKYILGFFIFFVGFYVLSVIDRILIVHVAEPLTRKPPFTQETIHEILTDWKFIVTRYLPSNIWISMIFLFVKYVIGNEQKKVEHLNLAKQKAELELKTLKGQLNPHFLFNTLNNIYSLSLDNSPKTSESIAKLSEMLDHVLYRSDSRFVPLKSELALIKNYIELEKLRYDERLQVALKQDITREIEIPPLILLSLVENAFKHGAGEDGGSPKIDITIKSSNENFEFRVENSIAEDYTSDNKKSIGLLNIKKQLDLIYGERYTLKTENKANQFVAQLTIKP